MRHARTVVAIALCSVIGFVAANAFAGYKATQPVVISGSTAYGTLGSTRGTTDTTQYIGCSVSKTAGGTVSASCSARSSTNAYLSCTTTDPDMIAMAANVNSISWIYFTVSGSNCSYLVVSNWSHYPPMVP